MPKLNDETLTQYNLATNSYGYSGTRLDKLGADGYTLVTICRDKSASVSYYRDDLEKTTQSIIGACKSSPRADNLLIRLVDFNQQLDEVHGFKMLQVCNIGDYQNVLHCSGSTALFDAAENSVTATVDYAKHLAGGDFEANAIIFVITDGEDNASTLTTKYVKQALADAVQTEALESIVTVLIGVNVTNSINQTLQRVKDEIGFTQYIGIADASPSSLAKLAEFTSKSISSQSKSLGTGQASTAISLTI